MIYMKLVNEGHLDEVNIYQRESLDLISLQVIEPVENIRYREEIFHRVNGKISLNENNSVQKETKDIETVNELIVGQSEHTFYDFCYLYIQDSIQNFYTPFKKVEKIFFYDIILILSYLFFDFFTLDFYSIFFWIFFCLFLCNNLNFFNNLTSDFPLNYSNFYDDIFLYYLDKLDSEENFQNILENKLLDSLETNVYCKNDSIFYLEKDFIDPIHFAFIYCNLNSEKMKKYKKNFELISKKIKKMELYMKENKHYIRKISISNRILITKFNRKKIWLSKIKNEEINRIKTESFIKEFNQQKECVDILKNEISLRKNGKTNNRAIVNFCEKFNIFLPKTKIHESVILNILENKSIDFNNARKINYFKKDFNEIKPKNISGIKDNKFQKRLLKKTFPLFISDFFSKDKEIQ